MHTKNMKGNYFFEFIFILLDRITSHLMKCIRCITCIVAVASKHRTIIATILPNKHELKVVIMITFGFIDRMQGLPFEICMGAFNRSPGVLKGGTRRAIQRIYNRT